MGNIGQAMMTIPRIKAMQQYREQMAQTAQAREQSMAQEQAAREALLGSQKGLADANTKSVLKKLSLVEALQSKTAPALEALIARDMKNPAIDDYVNTASAATEESKGDVVKALQGLLGSVTAAGGDTARGAALMNPVSVANNAADNAEKAGRPVVAGNGSTVFTPTGQPMATAATTLNPGQTRFSPSSNISSALTQVAQGQPMQPKTSERDRIKDEIAEKIILQQGDTGNGTTNTISSALAQMPQYAAQPSQGAPQQVASLNPDDVAWLMKNPTPARIQQFESIYGAGSSKIIH